MPGLDDYGALIRSGQAAVPDYAADEAQQQLRQLQITQQRMQLTEAAQKLHEQQSFQDDLTHVLANPSADNYSALALKHPAHAEQIKSSFEMQDKAKRDSDLRSMVDIYAPAQAGKYDLSAALLQRRIDADKQAGQDTSHDQMILDALNSGDPTQQKAAVGMMGYTLAAITGDKFNETLGTLNKPKGYTLAPGDVRFDDNDKQVASVAAKPDFLVVPEGGKAIPLNSAAAAVGGAGGGDPTSSGAGVAIPPNATPAVKEVASTLASSGLPATVVAGFMGNFHAEGGYDGAQGDGGSASGIGQWRGERAANFERVIGKPVTEATPTEQAQFVTWEMQNPEAAGMTVAQRDAILNAKTAPQAAALIDQFYERSSGRDRSVRMAAANAFAGGGSQATQPGDVPGTVYGNPKPQARILAPQEAKARGLDTSKVYEQHPDGTISAVGEADSLSSLPGNPNLSGPAYLATVPKNLATQVKALAEGRLPMPSSFALAKPYWQKLLQMTAQYDPTFDAANAPARKAAITAFTGMGKAAQVVGSVNRVANHLNTLWNESKKLAGPETGFSLTNSLLATAGQAFEPADAKAYDTAVGFVAGELEKIARNSPGTEAGVERVVKSLGRHNSTGTREAAIKTAVDIIAGAIDPLKDQYNSAFTNDSTRPKIPWVSPQAQKVYEKIGGTNGGVDLSLTGAGADSNSPTDAQGGWVTLPSGLKIRKIH